MAICEWCGETFDPEEAEEYFNDYMGLLSYEHITKCLCGKCAVEAIEGEVPDVYYVTCEKCGKTFDYCEDYGEFAWTVSPERESRLFDYWYDQILCCECALELDSLEQETIDD